MNCLLCGSSNIKAVDTIVSDFVMARICDNFRIGKNYKTKLCFCRNCSFAYYDYRFSEEEARKLYENYRDEAYQKTREHYECWYTPIINQLLNSDSIALNEQRKQISTMLFANTKKEIKTALDYGGNEGKTFTNFIGKEKKFVYDISGVRPVEGIQLISKEEDLKKHSYDFIMCNALFEHLANPVDVLEKIAKLGNENTLFYIEVPSENPFIKGNKFSFIKNYKLVVNPNYSVLRLIKFYIKSCRGPFMPMKEHINFFTEESLQKMLKLNGFDILEIVETMRKSSLGESEVLAVLFKMKQ